MPASRRRWPWIGVLVVAALAVLAFDSNWLKGPVERAVSARMGRTFEIRGELDIVPRPTPRVVMTDVLLQNPAWAIEPHTLRLERAEVAIALMPLLRGHVVLPEVSLVKPVIALERSADGQNNWTLRPTDEEDSPEEPAKEGEPPVIGRLTVDEGVLLFHDPADNTALTVGVATQPRPDGQSGVSFDVRGRFKGERLEAEGSGGSILSLADSTLAYPLAVKARIGATAIDLDGTITGLVAFAAADLQLGLSGESLADLYALVRVSLPPTPPYRIEGRLIRDQEYWRFHDFDGRVGDSDLSGDVDVTFRNARPHMQATLTSQRLDLDDLGGAIGATPETGPGETASPKQQREEARQEARPTVLPDLPLKLDRLRAMDAEVRFTGKSIRGRTALDDIKVELTLENGVLALKPLDFGVAGGNVVSRLVLDGRSERPGVDADVEFKRIDLSRMFPGNATIQKSTGIVGGRAVLQGTGHSFAEVLGNSDGSLGLAMSGGHVSNLVLELAGLDVAEALASLFRGDRQVEVRCAVADLDVRDGVMRSKSTILDTTDTNVKVEGELNLATEELDLTLHPLPKDYSPLALRSPIHVKGTFKDPLIRPDQKLLLRGGVAAVLGTVAAPLAALVGLIETGPGDDVDCERLVAAVERQVRKDLPEAGSP